MNVRETAGQFWSHTVLRIVVFVVVASIAVTYIVSRQAPRIGQRPQAVVCAGLQRLPIDVTQLRLGRLGALCTHGNDPAGEVAGAPASGGQVFCYGDGIAGMRVEAIYAHAADVSDRFNQVVGSLHGYAAAADADVNDAAAETGGVRHFRFVVDQGGCVLTVHDVALSITGDDTFGNTINEVASRGFNRSDRKYLIWVDASVYCGIGTIDNDDQPGPGNANNDGPSYSRVDRGCWGGNVEAHELGHNLGAVQLSAPHSSKAWHCYDESDLMCYADGGSYFANGGQLTHPCASSHERLADCGHDDYFSTAASSYLANHWNVADSAFLEHADGSNTPGPTTSTTGTTLPPPTTTSTTRPSCIRIFNRCLF